MSRLYLHFNHSKGANMSVWVFVTSGKELLLKAMKYFSVKVLMKKTQTCLTTFHLHIPTVAYRCMIFKRIAWLLEDKKT